MARLLGVDIPNRKKVGYSICYIYGVGPTRAKEILDAVEIDSNRRTQDLTEQELSLITNYIIDNKIIKRVTIYSYWFGLRSLKITRSYAIYLYIIFSPFSC